MCRNIMENSILNIIAEYNPFNNPYIKALLEDGISGLLREVESNVLSMFLSIILLVKSVEQL